MVNTSNVGQPQLKGAEMIAKLKVHLLSRLARAIALALLLSQLHAAQAPVAKSKVDLSACLMQNGLAYGPFRDGEGPDMDIYPSAAQIQEDVRFLSQITK